ncbi:hypothetical protein M8C21_004916, partial [Ambrosia artemisiifolia]
KESTEKNIIIDGTVDRRVQSIKNIFVHRNSVVARYIEVLSTCTNILFIHGGFYPVLRRPIIRNSKRAIYRAIGTSKAMTTSAWRSLIDFVFERRTSIEHKDVYMFSSMSGVRQNAEKRFSIMDVASAKVESNHADAQVYMLTDPKEFTLFYTEAMEKFVN